MRTAARDRHAETETVLTSAAAGGTLKLAEA
jgi:hypothetical protein